MQPRKIIHILLAFIALAGATACSRQNVVPTIELTPTNTVTAQTPTMPEPTPITEPLAAQVNGEGISVRDFEAELARLQASQKALGITMSLEEQRKTVMDELVGQTLLARAARENGYSLDGAGLQSRIDALAASMGGADALAGWQAAHGYSPENFAASLARAAAAEWMASKLQAEVPLVAEQVHARQILVFDQASAENALNRLSAGTEFATLAYKYDTVTGGDLGWFPKGYLLAPEVEEAAFALEPGQVSGIIKSNIGYHIITVIEKDAQRQLSPDTLLLMKKQAVEKWMASKLAESQVVILN